MLIRNTLLYLPAQLLGPLFQFIAAVVWTHWLNADSYGVLTYVVASHELVYVACLAWWSQYTLRYAATYAEPDARARFQSTENTIILLGVPAQIALVALLLSALNVPLTIAMTSAASVACVSRAATTHLCERARAAGRIWVYTIGQSVGPVLGFAIALALVKFVAATPEAALAGFAVAQIAGLVWMWRELDLPATLARFDRGILKAALRFGAPLLVAGAIAWPSANGIRLIVEHVKGSEAVGLVSVGWGLGQRLSSVIAMLVTAAAFPLAVQHMVAGSRAEALKQLSQGGAILFALVAPAAAGIALTTRPMVELMISPAFRDATIAVLPLAALAGVVRNLRLHYCEQVFILFARTDLNIAVSVVETLATIALCLAGVVYAGLPGAAAGCLAGSAISTLFGFAVAVSRFGLRPPWDHVARILAATAVMSAVLMTPPVADSSAPALTRFIVDIVVGGAAYALALAALYPWAARLAFARLSVLRAAN